MHSFDLHPYFQKVSFETKNDQSIHKERDFIEGFFENWVGEFLHPYGDDLSDAGKLDHSLYYCYLSGQSTNFHWYAHSLCCGAYTVVFRELRCILEGLFIVFKIEHNNFGKTLDEKLLILRKTGNNKNSYGKGVFLTSGFTDWESYHSIYKELSSYIHFSYTRTADTIRKIEQDGFPETLDYQYNKTSFQNAYRIWRKMAGLSMRMAVQLSQSDKMTLTIPTHLFD